MSTRHTNDHLRKLCACQRRTWPKCPHAWHFNFKWRDTHYRFSLNRELGKQIESKTEAEAARDQLCADIRNGVFRKRGSPASGPVLEMLTVSQFFDAYERDYVDKVRPESLSRSRAQHKVICRQELVLATGDRRALGDWLLSDVNTSAIKQFQEVRRKSGQVAMNRDLGVLRALFNWGLRDELIQRSPFKRGGVNAIIRAKERRRSRRLEPGEAQRLLAASEPDLRARIEGALEIGCRKEELLSLQWSQVRLDSQRPAIVLTADKTKTKVHREVPISARLRAILEMRNTDPAGNRHVPGAYVFGDRFGQRVGDFKRSWAAAKLKAHGYPVEYVKGTARLTAECTKNLRSIDLHFHDLRREAGSRWLDAGVPLHTIQRWLGHTNISQTSTYLSVTDTGSHDAMARFDSLRGSAPSLQPFATEVETEGLKVPRNGTM